MKCHEVPCDPKNAMFRGRSNHTIDSKGRLAIPARFREVLDKKEDPSLIVTNFETGADVCLWAYAAEDWYAVEERVLNLPQFQPATNTLYRYFISGAVECPLKQGRITIPPNLRETAGLEKEVVLVGALKKFEIWEKQRWEREFQRARKDFPKVSEVLAELGI
jgi:MraZ protein